ncbi:hypothetical protein [Nocardioides sp. AE5]|uniref:hypothetical protein n=1 Tax=Nocardioides sp. AE5 TaxID=2962573 RepID=UPI0028826B09|nr:hypothetical protein [Nocardioides sp. AE5]MDT0201520.1 hypothetical protein [Nocardioides sp. AE5]
MSDVSWMALALALTACGGMWTWYAYRNRGIAATVRGVALTLLPGAAWLTGTLELFGEVAGSVADWAVGFAFSPLVWVGIAMFVLSVLLFGVSTRISAPPGGAKGRKAGTPDAVGPAAPPKKGAPALDDDLADIEAILRKRGIS